MSVYFMVEDRLISSNLLTKNTPVKRIGVIVTDQDANIVQVNEDFTLITQFKEEDVIGKNPRILQSGMQTPLFYQSMWASLKKNKKWSGILWNRRKDRSLFLEYLEIKAITNGKGEVTHYRGEFRELAGLTEALVRLLPQSGHGHTKLHPVFHSKSKAINS